MELIRMEQRQIPEKTEFSLTSVTSIFKNNENTALRKSLTAKWIEFINQMEKKKKIMSVAAECEDL